MTTAMLAAIAADLDDDTRRLAYADWLDEHDDHDRAELIRVQCRLPGLDSHDHSALFAAMRRPGGQRMPHCQLCDEWLDAKGRERELIAAHPEWMQWECQSCLGTGVPDHQQGSWNTSEECEPCGGWGYLLKKRRITWDRGWPGWVYVERVSELLCWLNKSNGVVAVYPQPHPSPNDLLEEPWEVASTPLLTALAQTPPWGVPLRGVIVEELRPAANTDGWWWWRGENIDSVLFNSLPDKPNILGQNGAWYPTEQAAIRAAAAAFLEFGRKHK